MILQAVALGCASAAAGRRVMHYLQLESYQLPGYVKSVKRNAARAFLPSVAMAAAGVAALVVSGLSGLALLLEALMALLLVVRASREKAKKPFVVTERVKRLIAIHAAVNTLLAFILLWISPVLAYLLPAFEPALLMLAAVIAAPLEKHIANQFVKDAQARLDAMPSLIKIGITGSYGKTSTKFLLRDILSVKYSVLATPSSFNTTMGVTRVIREQLTPAHQVFIAEMGARHVGDIKELVELVHPSMGLITSVGPQHLDTFGTIERVRDTKYELIDGLPKDGTAIFAPGRRNLRGALRQMPAGTQVYAGHAGRCEGDCQRPVGNAVHACGHPNGGAGSLSDEAAGRTLHLQPAAVLHGGARAGDDAGGNRAGRIALSAGRASA